MAEEVVGKARYETEVDPTGLEQGLGKADETVSKSAAQAEQAYSGKATEAANRWGKAGYAAGALVGSGLLLVAKGAADAQRAQGDFMAATGASRDEAKAFVSDMNGLAGSAGTVGRSFGDVAAAGTLIAQQMGTTREETQALTGQILAFAKANKIDATTAITGLDDAMDAWGLTAADTGRVMDVVTAGVQEFGGTASSSLNLLNSLAPALQAANMKWDDAAGVINLFNRAGVDANVTATAFARALQQVESPEELQQLVSDIAATEDPFERAQLAAEVFGAKAGPKLALALADSGGDLTAFKIGIEDAAGATTTAAESMLTDGDKIRGAVDKIMAGAREVGQEFGPALSGLAGIGSLVSPLISKFKPLITEVSKAILPTAVAAGTARGVAAGEAEAVGATGAGVIRSFLSKFGLMTPAKVGAAVVAGTAVGVAEGEAAAAAATGPEVLAKAGAGGKLMGAAMGAGVVIGLAAVAPEIEKIAQDLGRQANHSVFDQFGSQAKGLAYGTVFDSIFDTLHVAWDRIGQYDPLASAATKSLSTLLIYATEHSLDGLAARDAFNAALEKGLSVDAAYAAGMRAAHGTAQGYEEYLAQWAASGIQGPPIPQNLWEGTATEVGAAGAQAAATSYEQYLAQWAASGVQGPPIPRELWVAKGTELGTGLSEGAERALAETMRWEGIAAEWQRRAEAPFVALGKMLPQDIASGAVDNGTALLSAADRLITLLKEGLSPAEQAAKLEGKKYTKAVAEGVVSEIPGAKDAARALAVQAIKTIGQVATDGHGDTKDLKTMGKYYDDLLVSGMTAQQAAAALRAAGVSEAIIAALGSEARQDQAAAGGSNVGAAYVGGVAKGIQTNRYLISTKLDQIDRMLYGNSPPVEGPLSNVDVGGFNVGTAWGDGLLEGVWARARALPTALSEIGGMLAGSMGGRFGMAPLLATAGLEVRHTVSLDLRNAPAGITTEGVADVLRPVLATFEQGWRAKIDEAQAATRLRWVGPPGFSS